MSSYGALLRRARERLGITQTELAMRLRNLVPGARVTQSMVSEWESGHRVPIAIYRHALARLLDEPRLAVPP